MTFAYQGVPVSKLPAGCTTTTLATVDHDIRAALEDLAQAVGAHDVSPPRQPRTPCPAPSGTLTPVAIGQSLCALLPQDVILVDEAITMGLTTFELTKGARRHDYLFPDCGGAIGAGLPHALGAAIACPDRKVVALQADGSAMYTNQALWSIARENADVTVVLLRNDSYAVLHFEMARVRAGEETERLRSLLDLDRPGIDWVQLAQAQGVPASRATTAEEFHQQLQAALAVKGPRLIEAQVTQDIQPFLQLVRAGRP
jgi:acetolactate synthase-1/2/3 large subunit